MAHADSVRLALPADAPAIAALQAKAWSTRLPEAVLPSDATDVWEQAITRPPLAACRVLVAVTDEGVVGFAAVAPSTDPDAEPTMGEISEFVADGEHADRLLHACVDTLVQDGFTVARCWLSSTDDERRAWLRATGWEPDGAHQEIGDDSARLKLVRLHTSVA